MLKNIRIVMAATALATSAFLGAGALGSDSAAHAAGNGYAIGPNCASVISDLESSGWVFGPEVQGECASAWFNPQSMSSANTADSCAAFWVPIGVFPSQGACVSYFVYYFKTH